MICKDSLSYKIMDYIRKSIDDEPKYVKIFDECKILIEQGINIAILQAINDNADYIDKSGIIKGLFDIINSDREQLKEKIIKDMDMKEKKRSAPGFIRDYTGICRYRTKDSIEAIRNATNYYLHDDFIPIQNETLEILMKLEDYFNITTNQLFENITEEQQKIIININEIIQYVIEKYNGDTKTNILNDFGYTSEKELNDTMKILNNYNEDIDDDLEKLLEEITKGKLFHGEDISELSEMMNHGDLFSRIIKRDPMEIVEEEHIDFDDDNDIFTELDLLITKEDNYVSHAGLMKKLKEFFNSHKTPEKKTKKSKKPIKKSGAKEVHDFEKRLNKPIKKSGAKEVHDSIHDFEKRLDKLMKGL